MRTYHPPPSPCLLSQSYSVFCISKNTLILFDLFGGIRVEEEKAKQFQEKKQIEQTERYPTHPLFTSIRI